MGEVDRRLEVRWDPLLGTSSRVVEGVHLQTADPEALLALSQPDSNCPFCPQNLESVTPRMASSISSEPRIRVGETLLFPNLVPYSQYSAVAIFSPRHRLSLTDFTADLLTDNLTAAIRYVQDVQRFDSGVNHCAYNVNYLYPSGGSLPHPHAQVFLDPFPTTMLRLQYDAGKQYWSRHRRCYWDDLAAEEEQRAERFVGRLGATTWMTAFAPLGFNEVRAVVAGAQTLLDLSGEDVQSLGEGIRRVLCWYDSLAYNSFNLALYSGALGARGTFRVNLCIMTRSALTPYYRSDAMYLERLHWEAAVDRSPEALATELGPYFAS
jgi:UDPglucose--hexose-1-phosphate uridylyltransferase